MLSKQLSCRKLLGDRYASSESISSPSLTAYALTKQRSSMNLKSILQDFYFIYIYRRYRLRVGIR